MHINGRLPENRRRQGKPLQDCVELHKRACELLVRAGFERCYVAMKTDSVYFRFPGRHGNIRVSHHPSKQGPIGLDSTLAKITLRGNAENPMEVKMAYGKFESLVYMAIGQYMVLSDRPVPSRYHGRRGTWDENTPAIERP